MLILALEASTTSAKTLVFDTESQQVEVRSRSLESRGADGAVRDGDSVYGQLMALGREAAEGRQIDAIALSGTWHGLTLRESDLRQRTPVMEWSYTGAQSLTARLRRDEDFTSWFYGHTGCMVNAIYPAFKLAMLAEQGVRLDDALALDQASLIFARMTGKVWMSRSSASGTGLLAAGENEWDDEVFERLGLPRVRLPELHESTDTAPLGADAAALLGVRPGVPVLVASPDGGLSQVGDRADGPGDMTFSMGTSGALRFAVPHPSFSPTMSTWTYRSPIGWLSGAATSGCGNCVDWAKGTLFGEAADYADIEPLLRDDRRDLPVFLPFLFGERSPGWQDQRQGGFLDMQPRHARVDLYQAVLQGVTFSLVHCFKELTAINGFPRRIVLSGGVLSSPFWSQFTVDAFGVEMETSARQHSSVVGATRMALRTLDLDDDPPAFDEGEARILTPDLERTERLRGDLDRYLDAYERTVPSSDEAVTGA
ncbi:gluconokinase [Homoserinibacter sp. GY 40078]|uniref:gluconokinase n=1 Tax=Homoserinibacter sp. GY 40078 TaxID=2603275 RepID=UPI0011C6F691|nr:FGGY-family carbohydrate kinase [Homoserinibacter sp. GY 40078]TXK19523.1 hypothetical protein FVQ89_06460 [Homoserinibacter sp. GY 40078]